MSLYMQFAKEQVQLLFDIVVKRPVRKCLHCLGFLKLAHILGKHFDFYKHEQPNKLLPNKLPLLVALLASASAYILTFAWGDMPGGWMSRTSRQGIEAVVLLDTGVNRMIKGRGKPVPFVDYVSYTPFRYCEKVQLNETHSSDMCVDHETLCASFLSCADEKIVKTMFARCNVFKQNICGARSQIAGTILSFAMFFLVLQILAGIMMSTECVWKWFLRVDRSKSTHGSDKKLIEHNYRARRIHLRILTKLARTISFAIAGLFFVGVVSWLWLYYNMAKLPCGPEEDLQEGCASIGDGSMSCILNCCIACLTIIFVWTQPNKFKKKVHKSVCAHWVGIETDSDSSDDEEEVKKNKKKQDKQARKDKKHHKHHKHRKQTTNYDAEHEAARHHAACVVQKRIRGHVMRKIAQRAPLPSSKSFHVVIVESAENLPSEVEAVACHVGIKLHQRDSDVPVAIWKWCRIVMLDSTKSDVSFEADGTELDIELKDGTFATLAFKQQQAPKFAKSCQRFIDRRNKTGESNDDDKVDISDMDIFEVEVSMDSSRTLPGDVDIGISEEGVYVLEPGTRMCLKNWKWKSIMSYNCNPHKTAETENTPLVGGDLEVFAFTCTGGKYSFVLPRIDAVDMAAVCSTARQVSETQQHRHHHHHSQSKEEEPRVLV